MIIIRKLMPIIAFLSVYTYIGSVVYGDGSENISDSIVENNSLYSDNRGFGVGTSFSFYELFDRNEEKKKKESDGFNVSVRNSYENLFYYGITIGKFNAEYTEYRYQGNSSMGRTWDLESTYIRGDIGLNYFFVERFGVSPYGGFGYASIKWYERNYWYQDENKRRNSSYNMVFFSAGVKLLMRIYGQLYITPFAEYSFIPLCEYLFILPEKSMSNYLYLGAGISYSFGSN